MQLLEVCAIGNSHHLDLSPFPILQSARKGTVPPWLVLFNNADRWQIVDPIVKSYQFFNEPLCPTWKSESTAMEPTPVKRRHHVTTI